MHKFLISTVAIAFSGMVVRVEAAQIESIVPQSVAYGKATDISVGIADADSNAVQVTLSPGGPGQSRLFSLAEPARDIALYNNQMIIADGAAGLIALPMDAAVDTAVEATVLSDSDSLAVRIAGDTAYVLTAGRELLILDLARTGHPKLRDRYALRDDVKDFAAEGHIVCLLYRDDELVVINTDKQPGANRTTSIRPEDEVTHLAIHQGVVYAATSNGVLIFDLRDETQFGAAGIFKLLDGAGALATRDNMLLVAGRNGGLTVVDVADPQAPRWLASHHRVGLIRKLVVDGDNLLALRNDGRLLLLDLALPAMPTIVSGFKVGGEVQAVALSMRQAVVTTATEVWRIDFSAEPPFLSNEMLDIGQGVNFGGQRRAFVENKIAYVADWFSGMHIYDISDAQLPRLLASLHTPGSPKGVVVKAGIAYVADDDHGLQIVDVQDPRNPRLIGNLPTGGLAYTPKIVGDRLYLASHRGGFQIVDISDPRAPRLLSEYDTPGKAWSIDVSDGLAYVADDDAGLLVFDVHDAAQPALIGSFVPGGHVEEVLIDGKYAYIALFDDGVYVLDVSTHGNPRPLAHIATPGNARGLDLHGKKLYVADWLAGVHVVDVSQPDKPVIIASYDTDGAAWGIKIVGDNAVVLDWWGGLVTLDVSDPARPQLAARYNARGRIRQVSAVGDFLVTAHGAGGLQVFDIRNALNPTWVSTVELPADATRLSVVEDVAYVALKGGGIALIDIRQPFEARQIGTLEYAGSIERMQVAGHWLYVLDRASGLAIFDIQQRQHPVRIGGHPGRINDFFADGTALFTAMPNREILLFDATEPQNLVLKQRVQLAYEPARLTATREQLVSYDKQQISIYSRRASAIVPGGITIPLDDVRAVTTRGATLLANVANGKLRTWTLAADAAPVAGPVYTLTNPVERLFVYRDVVYFAGSQEIIAMQLLPAHTLTARERNRIRLSLSPELPAGAYDVLMTDANGTTLRAQNAVTVAMPRFSKPKFTQEDFEKAMQQRPSGSAPVQP